jgi:hypothetical protein
MELMQAFGDGELEGEERVSVRDHLRTCDSCRRSYDQRRRLVQALAAALSAEATAPAGLAGSVRRRLVGWKPAKITFSVAGTLGLVVALTWMLLGRDLVLAKAIDQAMRQVKSAHFTAVEGGRKITVWATPEAERIESSEGWVIATGGRAYLFDPDRRRVTITKGPLAQLQLLRSLNVLMLSARLRGQVMGEPRMAKETVRLPDGRKAIRITATGRARVLGITGDFRGTMLVDASTNLIMGGEITETRPDLRVGEEGRRRGVSHVTHVKVGPVEYNARVPAGIFDTRVPPGWSEVRK